MSITADSLRQGLSSKTAFNTDAVKNALQDKLQKFENSIIEQSKKYVEQLTTWSDNVTTMGADIDEISGSFEKIKNDAGMKLISNSLIAGKPPTEMKANENILNDQQIQIPDFPVDINIAVLDSVGHQKDDVSTEGKTLDALITVIPPGQPMPEFWSRYQDFFAPEVSTQLYAEDDDFETSFSIYYNFNPIPIAVEETRKQLAQAGQPLPKKK